MGYTVGKRPVCSSAGAGAKTTRRLEPRQAGWHLHTRRTARIVRLPRLRLTICLARVMLSRRSIRSIGRKPATTPASASNLSVPTSTVTRMSDDVCTIRVSDRVLDELADVLLDRIDQLLDRLIDRAMAAPTAGSRRWESAWNERDTAEGRARADEQARVRDELTRRAVVELASNSKHSSLGAPGRHLLPVTNRRARPRRSRVDEGQLAFF